MNLGHLNNQGIKFSVECPSNYSEVAQLFSPTKKFHALRSVVPINFIDSTYASPLNKIQGSRQFLSLSDDYFGKSVQPTNSPRQNLNEQYSDEDIEANAKKLWKKLGNVVKSLRRFQTNMVKNIDHPKDLDGELNHYNFPTSPRLNTQSKNLPDCFDERVSDLRIVERLCSHAQNGSGDDIKQIKKIILQYKKIHLYSPEDPQHLINKLNRFGLSPLYLACRNGNYHVIAYLLLIGVNPYLKSLPQKGHKETPIEVAVRWNHLSCVNLMLEERHYDDASLLKLLKLTQNPEMKLIIKSKIKRKGYFCCL